MKHAQRWTEWLDDAGFGIEICLHSVKTPEELEKSEWTAPQCWNTYLYFADQIRYSKDGELCAQYCEPSPLVDLLWKDESLLNQFNWNGGITFLEKVVDQKTGQRRIKAGDDYVHLWDSESNAWKYYDLDMMKSRIRRIAKEADEVFKAHLRFLEKEKTV